MPPRARARAEAALQRSPAARRPRRARVQPAIRSAGASSLPRSSITIGDARRRRPARARPGGRVAGRARRAGGRPRGGGGGARPCGVGAGGGGRRRAGTVWTIEQRSRERARGGRRRPSPGRRGGRGGSRRTEPSLRRLARGRVRADDLEAALEDRVALAGLAREAR